MERCSAGDEAILWRVQIFILIIISMIVLLVKENQIWSRKIRSWFNSMPRNVSTGNNWTWMTWTDQEQFKRHRYLNRFNQISIFGMISSGHPIYSDTCTSDPMWTWTAECFFLKGFFFSKSTLSQCMYCGTYIYSILYKKNTLLTWEHFQEHGKRSRIGPLDQTTYIFYKNPRFDHQFILYIELLNDVFFSHLLN